MDQELKSLAETISKEVHDLKTDVATRYAEKADKGYVDSAVEERLDARIKDVFAKMDTANAHINEKLDLMGNRFEKMDLLGDPSAKLNSEAAIHAAAFTKELRANSESARDGRFEMTAEEYLNYSKAQELYLRRGDKALDGQPELRAAMSVGSDPNGGYWVEPDTSGRMIKKIYETSPIRQYATVVKINTDALEGPIDNEEASTGWVGETEPRPETATPTIGEYRIPVHEQYANPRITQKLLDDSSRDVAGWLADKVSDKMSRTENAAFITGDGEKKPRGLLTYTAVTTADATRAWGEIQYIPSGKSADFADTNPENAFFTLIGSVKKFYRSNARFLMNRLTLTALMKEKDADGNTLWAPMFTDNAFGLNVVGFPVVEDEEMPDIAADSLSIAFGDFRAAYTIVDRMGIRVLRDPYTAKPWVQFYTTKRVGGAMLNSEAYKVMKFAAS